MFPYMTPMQIRLERELRERISRFPTVNDKRIRAELEARLLEESDSLLARDERPARRFNFRAMLLGLPRMSFLKLQRNLK